MRRSLVILVPAILCLVTSVFAEEQPLLAGVEGVSNPVRVKESYVRPDYPEQAKEGELEGKVILQAVITKNGVVERVEVLKTTNPGHGFEEAAIAAVRHWRYEPAQHRGEPVDVYFTIRVDFTPSSGRPLLAGKDGVTNPVRIRESYVKPRYAQELREAGIEGKVILQAIVTKDGHIRDVEVLKSTNPGHGLEEAAIEAVKQWRYKPAMKDNRPVEVYFTIRMDFTLG